MRSLLVLFWLVHGFTAFGIGYGPDLIDCHHDANSTTEHLDYTLRHLEDFTIAPSDDPIQRIQDYLLANTQHYGLYLKRYLDEFGKGEQQQYWRWRAREFDQPDVRALSAVEIQAIPRSCDQASLRQVIRMDFRDWFYWANYNPEALDQLKTQSALQHSYAIIHEWMWQFTNRREVIRKVNNFLHSLELEGPHEYDLDSVLHIMGLHIAPDHEHDIDVPVEVQPSDSPAQIKFNKSQLDVFFPGGNGCYITLYNRTEHTLMISDSLMGPDYYTVEPGEEYGSFNVYYMRSGWISVVVYDQENWPPEQSDRISIPIRNL